MSRVDFSGKVVLITGASSDIGAAVAVELAQHGARLALTGRNGANLQSVADNSWRHLTEAKHTNARRPMTIVADLQREDDVRGIVEQTFGRFHRLDILVNNAGVGSFGSLENSSLEQFDQVMGVNVRAVCLLTMLCAPHLAVTKGNIINMSSSAGSQVHRGMVAYSLSKASLDQLTHCSALELAEKGVRINGVIPGTVGSTQMRKRTGLSNEHESMHVEWTKRRHPLGRLRELEDVVRAVVFLASDNASIVTGQSLHVDGGKHLATSTQRYLPLLFKLGFFVYFSHHLDI